MKTWCPTKQESAQAVVCVCADDSSVRETLRDLLLRRMPSVEVLVFRSLSEIAPNKISPSKSDAPFLILFSIGEQEWRRVAQRRSSVWPLSNALASFALTDSAEKGFLGELFEAGVNDYFLDVPAGRIAATGRVAREIERRNLVAGITGADYSESGQRDSLAEKVRRETFRETVAAINHQINNPLSEILATVEMFDSTENELSGMQSKRLREIQNSARRIQRVTTRLLDLVNPSSQHTPAGRMIDISAKASARIQSRLTSEHLGREKAETVIGELSDSK